MVLDGDSTVLERALRPDCFAPPAPPVISADCALGGASVVLDNPTPTPLDYVITVDGGPRVVTVAAFSIERVAVPIVENTSRQIVVHGGGTTELARADVPRDCERPQAVVSLECASRSVAFTLTNDGSLRSTVELMIDGRVVVSIPVDGGGRAVARLDLAEDQTAVAAARSAGVELVSRRVTLDCQPATEPLAPKPPAPTVKPAPPAAKPTTEPAAPASPTQVLGVSFGKGDGTTFEKPSATMPVTGFDTHGLVQLALLLLVSGGALISLQAFMRREEQYEA
jgi:hypothetical protein